MTKKTSAREAAYKALRAFDKNGAWPGIFLNNMQSGGETEGREAALAAAPEFLEPIMKLEITTPPESVGEVLGDLNMRRGNVLDMAQRDDMQVVHARVPMAQMFGYATAIRSLTKGRASYSMEPSDFALVSKSVREHLLSL